MGVSRPASSARKPAEAGRRPGVPALALSYGLPWLVGGRIGEQRSPVSPVAPMSPQGSALASGGEAAQPAALQRPSVPQWSQGSIQGQADKGLWASELRQAAPMTSVSAQWERAAVRRYSVR